MPLPKTDNPRHVAADRTNRKQYAKMRFDLARKKAVSKRISIPYDVLLTNKIYYSLISFFSFRSGLEAFIGLSSFSFFSGSA